METDPPYGAKVGFSIDSAQNGWNAPAMADWLKNALQDASKKHFGKSLMYMGMGGSLPVVGVLANRFPACQFLVIGVLGPGSNAHGPNEFLHLYTGKRLTACVAEVLAQHPKVRE